MILYANVYSDSRTRLAQSVERPTFNRVVVGSIPTSGAYRLFLFIEIVGKIAKCHDRLELTLYI